jgi:pyroglutamyl-peptidase
MQIRRVEDPCVYEGDPDAPTKVLVTGFEPFPADAWHDNVSRVGVQAIDPSNLRGARLMRLVLPVEYDTTPGRIVDAIARCAPDVVIDFGQGGGSVAVEETAYNLKDTGEVPGGAPDNRGVIATATPIDPAGPTQRSTGLPLDAVAAAVEALGRTVRRSDDPGRYICNNVFYRVMGAVEGTGVRAGFIHLPYVTQFDDDDAAQWGRTLEAVVQAVVDAG